jgi:hypothetical protein
MKSDIKLLRFACSVVILKVVFLRDQVTFYVYMHMYELCMCMSSILSHLSSVKEKM